jgi:hypothetical protein
MQWRLPHPLHLRRLEIGSLERRVFFSGSLIVGRTTYHVYMPKTPDV